MSALFDADVKTFHRPYDMVKLACEFRIYESEHAHENESRPSRRLSFYGDRYNSGMSGLDFVRRLSFEQPMPMAQHFSFAIARADYGDVVATAMPSREHYNPFNVAQGGFAATVLDIVLGLVSISVMPVDAASVATTDLAVRYIRAITEETGPMTIRGSIVHAGNRAIVAEAKLYDSREKLYATAQSTSLVLRSAE